jgi:hypothetical protein
VCSAAAVSVHGLAGSDACIFYVHVAAITDIDAVPQPAPTVVELDEYGNDVVDADDVYEPVVEVLGSSPSRTALCIRSLKDECSAYRRANLKLGRGGGQSVLASIAGDNVLAAPGETRSSFHLLFPSDSIERGRGGDRGFSDGESSTLAAQSTAAQSLRVC